jgi:hypothetical protein
VRDRGVVDIHVDLDTLSTLNDHPGELAGYGPVIADIARQVAADQLNAQWTYTVTNPDGLPVTTDTTRRRPTATQQRSVTARNHTCVFPGCRIPARDCDLDHTTEWQHGGPTTTTNLAPLCRHDHRIKNLRTTGKRWTYTTTPDRTTTWTTPLGHTYTTTPNDTTTHTTTRAPPRPGGACSRCSPLILRTANCPHRTHPSRQRIGLVLRTSPFVDRSMGHSTPFRYGHFRFGCSAPISAG